MKAARLVLALAATSTLALGTVAIAPAQAATGDTWSGYKVVDVVPAATTQKEIVGILPTIEVPGGDDLNLFNMVRMVEDKNGRASWVYCIELWQGGEAPSYVESPLEASTPEGRANAAKLNRVLASSTLPGPGELEVTAPGATPLDTSRHLLPKLKKDAIEATAVQLAIWHFTDGINATSANLTIDNFYPASYVGDADDVTVAEILARYNALVAAANANPLDPAVPTIDLTPTTSTTEAGKALTFTVTGEDIDGTIKLSTDDAAVKLHPVKQDDSCDTATDITTLPAGGGKVCALSTTARSITITAKGASPEGSAHLLYALEAQSIIGVGPDAAQGSADAVWTGPTSTPSATPSETPSSTPSESSTSTPSVSETSSTGGAEVETEQAGVPSTGGNAAAPGGALADTGAFGLFDRLTLALAALGLGSALVVITRRRAQRTH